MKWVLGALGACCAVALTIAAYNASRGEYDAGVPVPAPIAQTEQPAAAVRSAPPPSSASQPTPKQEAPEPPEVRDAYQAFGAEDYAGLFSRTEKALTRAELSVADKTTLRLIRAAALLKQQRADKAAAELTAAESLDPTSGRPAGQLAYLFQSEKKYEQARAAYDRALSKSIQDELALEAVKLEYGWFLATCPDGGYRDGARAVQYAAQALIALSAAKPEALSGTTRLLRIFEVLAAGHAEAGDFDKAVAAANLAGNYRDSIKRIFPDTDPGRKGFDQRLAGYKAKRPWRDSEG
ncbi:MAG: tetratricopeptide repeat protein [Rhodospirillaceae bacterium]